jgi:2-polyprenyl-3-methyl-5-hydroxy-6-metoxy-1,4-benzoquinol methylase
MSPANPPEKSSELRKIEYLSSSAQVSMADSWFEIASMDHFWVRRRFEVLQSLCGNLISSAKEMAEIGCGHGLLQREIEIAYGREVTGFDLNEYALKRNVSRKSRVCCYDIFQKDEALKEKFDVIFLFDVLEHISDEDTFLKALLFHLAPEGKLIINVPAGPWAYSEYDVAAGHVRRYMIDALQETAQRNRLETREWTYWGLPLVPTLVVRKLWLLGKQDESKVITAGFDSRSAFINIALGKLSRLEWIPQKFLGTSLMAVLQRVPD